MPQYALHEFMVESDFVIPIADSVPRAAAPNAVSITLTRASLSSIPSLLRKVRRQLAYNVGTGFLIEPRIGVALYIDNKGEAITLDADEAHFQIALAWLIYALLGSATLLHGDLPLHGACLEMDGKCFCLMAESGAGKSTLSWYLLQQGARFGNDDLTPVRVDANYTICYPSVSLYPKLDVSVVTHYGIPEASLIPADYGTGEVEYFAALPIEKRLTTPAPLCAIFLLHPLIDCDGECKGECGVPCSCSPSDELVSGEVIPRRLSCEEAASMLFANLHAVWVIGKWLDNARLGQLCAEVAAKIPMYELTYCRSYASLPVLADTLRKMLRYAK